MTNQKNTAASVLGRYAMITSFAGHDGTGISTLLLAKRYKVHGAFPRTSAMNFWRIDQFGTQNFPQLQSVETDLTGLDLSTELVQKSKPDEIFKLTLQRFAAASCNRPATTLQITGLGALSRLGTIWLLNTKVRFFQACTSEMFGNVRAIPQREETPFRASIAFGVAKRFPNRVTVNYRESYRIVGSSGDLFKCERRLRRRLPVTQEVTDSAARVKIQLPEAPELGNFDAERDRGFSKEHADGRWRMRQADEPDVFVSATQRTETVWALVRGAFKATRMELDFRGQADDEIAVDIGTSTGGTFFRIAPEFRRPAEGGLLIEEPTKARLKLGCQSSTTMEHLCAMMMQADLCRNVPGVLF